MTQNRFNLKGKSFPLQTFSHSWTFNYILLSWMFNATTEWQRTIVLIEIVLIRSQRNESELAFLFVKFNWDFQIIRELLAFYLRPTLSEIKLRNFDLTHLEHNPYKQEVNSLFNSVRSRICEWNHICSVSYHFWVLTLGFGERKRAKTVGREFRLSHPSRVLTAM